MLQRAWLAFVGLGSPLNFPWPVMSTCSPRNYIWILNRPPSSGNAAINRRPYRVKVFVSAARGCFAFVIAWDHRPALRCFCQFLFPQGLLMGGWEMWELGDCACGPEGIFHALPISRFIHPGFFPLTSSREFREMGGSSLDAHATSCQVYKKDSSCQQVMASNLSKHCNDVLSGFCGFACKVGNLPHY